MNGPNARLMKANCSYGLPLYQAMKNSVAYAKPTIMPVASMILHIASMWSGRMMSLSPNR